jgi:SpoVK/Ycf46/Vps4 family AAA+-type ATPase
MNEDKLEIIDNGKDIEIVPMTENNGTRREERLCTVKEFAKELIRIFEETKTDEEKKFLDYFGIEKAYIQILVHSAEPFERNQVIYGVNKFIEEKCENVLLENYDDDKMPPTFESVEIKRKEFEMLVSIGFYFFTYKNKKFLIDLYFSGTARFYRIWFKSEDEELANELYQEIIEFSKNFNLYKGEKLLFLQQGTLEFLEYPNFKWRDVILSDELKEEFTLNILFPLENKEECKKYGIPYRRGLMLGGKAGTGKTQVCRVLCNVIPKGVTVLWATPKALYDEHSIQCLFEAARFFAPTLIIIEDIDFIGLNRDFARNPILGELLTQLDGNDPNEGIFVIATTNRPELLDEALANRPSRFDVQLLFELPTEHQRRQLIELFIKDMEFDGLLEINPVLVATKDLSGSHIKEIFVYCQLAALKAKRKVCTKDILMKAEKYKNNLIKNCKEYQR